MNTNNNDNDLLINIGGLESIASVYKHTSNSLSTFNKLWVECERPTIVWDMRNIKSGKMSIAAISFFLAIAHRVKQFTRCHQSCCIEWNPKTFGFLSDIGFFKIADSYDLIDWPYEIGGYESSRTNPNTLLLSCDPLMDTPDVNDLKQISEFKKVHREYYRQYIIDRCEALFLVSDNKRFSENIPLVMSRTCAELATNSLLWGQATPFLGLQRSSKSITISISDIGVGFRNSFMLRGQYKELINSKNSDIVSVALGSAINQFDFGLKRAISTVLHLKGYISITSNSGEIYWNNNLWSDYISYFNINSPENAIKKLPNPIYKASSDDKRNGYVRRWVNSIRGSRIAFDIPLTTI